MRAFFYFKGLWFLLLVFSLNSCTTFVDLFRTCPSEMAHVFVPSRNINICVDKYESSVETSEYKYIKPLSNLNYHDCKRYCAVNNKRLLSHREWLVSCEGTNPRYCNKFRAHPVLRKLRSKRSWYYRGKNCKNSKNTWGKCMQDLRLNRLRGSLARNGDFKNCVSKFGIYHMVGNLGEWVRDIQMRRGIIFGRFNGGLYPQKKSSCRYSTYSHGPNYRDYSIGCRCARTVNTQESLEFPF